MNNEARKTSGPKTSRPGETISSSFSSHLIEAILVYRTRARGKILSPKDTLHVPVLKLLCEVLTLAAEAGKQDRSR